MLFRTKFLQNITYCRRLSTLKPCTAQYPNYDFILNPENKEYIAKNIQMRKGVGDIEKVHELNQRLQQDPENDQVKDELLEAALAIPNETHPDVRQLGEEPRVVRQYKWESKHELQKVRSFDEIGRIVGGIRQQNLNPYAGPDSYVLKDQLAELEGALIEFAVNSLKDKFELVSVPDLVPPQIIEACGMTVYKDRTLVYQLDDGKTALSGTSEMALAGYFMNKVMPVNSTRRLMAVSRCFRAESSDRLAERGFYRVHQFTKVEMFAVTPGRVEESEKVHQEFVSLQEQLYRELDLCFRILDMPPFELGAPAYRKYDIEAELPGRKEMGLEFGEISSTSNCTDFQSRRLNIRDKNGDFCHTVNGTAMAIPRMIIALCEQNQLKNGCVSMPLKLRSLMRNADMISPETKDKRVSYQYVKAPKNFKDKTIKMNKLINHPSSS